MAISLKGKLAEKATALLGGKNLTEKRVEQLLEELAQARGEIAAMKILREADIATSAEVQTQRPRTPQNGELGGQHVPILGGATRTVTVEELREKYPDPDEVVDTGMPAHHAEVQPMVPATVDPLGTILAEMRAMRAELNALKTETTEEDKGKAIAAGKLPPAHVQAGPLGYTGSAQLPRGKWFLSPLGPKIQMRLCDCPQCKPTKVYHYFCVVCRRGPLPYLGQTGPKGRKLYTAPGSTWGVAHEVCTVMCWHQYLERIGVVAGVNDSEPPGMAGPDDQAQLAPGSD